MFKSTTNENHYQVKTRSNSLSKTETNSTGATTTTTTKKPPLPSLTLNHYTNKAYDEFISNTYHDDDDDNETYFQLNPSHHHHHHQSRHQANQDHFSALNMSSDRSNNRATSPSNIYGMGRVCFFISCFFFFYI